MDDPFKKPKLHYSKSIAWGFAPYAGMMPEVQAAIGSMQRHAEWLQVMMTLGASSADIDTFLQSANALAHRSQHVNSDVINDCKRLAKAAMLRGDPMPLDAAALLEAEYKRMAAQFIAGVEAVKPVLLQSFKDLLTWADGIDAFLRGHSHAGPKAPHLRAAFRAQKRQVLAASLPISRRRRKLWRTLHRIGY